MALFKNLEIDTLKLRTLLIATPNNSVIPSSYTLYSKGDGTTYWSTSIHPSEIAYLSSQVSSNTSNINVESSTLRSELISTLYSFSTFAINLSTYSTSLLYLDNQLSIFSTNIGTYNATKDLSLSSINISISTLSSKMSLGYSTLQSSINTLSTLGSLNNLSVNEISTSLNNLSSNTVLQFKNISTLISTNYGISEAKLIEKTIYLVEYTDNAISRVETSLINNNNLLGIKISTINNNLIILSTALKTDLNIVYLSSKLYTDISISSIFKSTLSLISTNLSINDARFSSITSAFTSSIQADALQNVTVISSVISGLESTNRFIMTDISTLKNTGLTASIYESFNQLVTYSESIVKSTISTVNTTVNSTLNYYNIVYTSTLNKINASTFDYVITQLYYPAFSSIVNSTNSILASSIDGYINVYDSPSPDIVVHKGYNLSTLYNVSTITGLSSIVASIINLDLTSYSKFSLTISDISNQVYYGLTYSTNTLLSDRDITLKVDVLSSFANNFINIDTGNLARWLGRPNIYNQSEYGLSNKPVQNIYLSSFIGKHIVTMRIMKDGLFIKDVLTYPYIYTNLSLTSNLNTAVTNLRNTNVQVSTGYTALLNSTFVYKNTSLPMSWTTNDPNLRVGVKFIGNDMINGNIITNWSGPYSASQTSTLVKIPSKSLFVSYNTIQIGVFPGNDLYNTSDSANISSPGQVFVVQKLTNPIYVLSPNVNSIIIIKNPGSLEKYLQVSEIKVLNDNDEDHLSDALNKYGKLKLSSSAPYQNDNTTWDINNINDGNIFTSYCCGSDATTVDYNAFISVEMSSLTLAQTPQTSISEIKIYGSQNNAMKFTIDGMMLRIENKNQPGIPDGLFYYSTTLTKYTPNVIKF